MRQIKREHPSSPPPERRRAEEAASFLAEAGVRLTSSLDYQRTLESVVQLATGGLADYCLIDLINDDGELEHVEVAAKNPANAPIVEKIRSINLVDHSASVAARVIATHESALIQDVVLDDFMEGLADDDPRRDVILEINPVSLMATPLIARGRFLGLIVFISAESGRHYDEYDLELARQLAVRAGLATDNARLYRNARAAVEARDAVQRIVAHDLRNPLTTVKMIADLISRDVSICANPAALRKHLDVQRHAVMQMNRLIEDLLDVARLDEGKMALFASPCNPAVLVDEGIRMYEVQAQQKSIELVADAAPNLPDIRADVDRIDQVLSNLIGNALKFTDPGGRIEVGAAAFEGGVTFSVSDTGCGIPPEQISHLFNRFWQAEKGARHGAGLGLEIAKGIIEAHGGQIWVESELGVGTTFFFFLPIATPNNHQ